MAKKDAIFKAVNDLISLTDEAIKEREQALRAVCCAYSVSNYDDIDDHNVWECAFNLQAQIEDLNDLRDDLKKNIKYIGTFKDVI